MPTYTPPIATMMFTLRHLVNYENSASGAALDLATLEAVLEEAGKLAADVLAPLNWTGDRAGSVWKDGVVTTAPGWRDAYQAYCAGGWNAVPFSPDFGGQGLPWAAAFPIQEMWQAANMAFGLCPLLNQGAVEAILTHGSAAQKSTYLPKLISGSWTGTMNLTEPQAGSDLSVIRTKAIKQADGTYKISGQKIFITYGEHDLTDNIIHLVLARTPDAPEGAKGISLFIVPKFLVNADGSLGERNDVRCVSIEHKLGIHASPTCTMVYGDAGGATGYLVGAENEGLKYMFTMMNNARLSVGLQGVAIADRAVQAAMGYARDRVQGRTLSDNKSAAIIEHADVKRMLLTMQALTMAGRALAYDAAVHLDKAHAGDKAAQDHVDLMTPIVKAWCTDIAQTVTSLGVQIHGGMGFVEETGVAQFFRDARILPIYEGTNGIQASDLVFRKVLRNKGDFVMAWVQKVIATPGLAPRLKQLQTVTDHLIKLADQPDAASAIATPYLNLFGTVAGGVMMARVVDAPDATRDMKTSARFYLDQILPMMDGYQQQILADTKTITGWAPAAG
jgi:3-(methylthio)propanoyl-CoA dehydrogenase